MKFGWMKPKGKEGDEKTEIEIPDEIGKNLEKLKDFDPEKLKTLDSMKSMLDSINKRFEKEDADKEAEKQRKAREDANRQRTEADEHIEELMVTDPVAAAELIVKKKTDAHAIAIGTMSANNLRREVFEDAERFPYYTGDIKAEIDKMLEGESLAARNNRNVVENAYWVTVGKKSKEINEGKVKDRFATPQGSRGTSGGNMHGGPDSESAPVITDEIKRLAEIFGQKPEEYAKELEKAGIGYV